MVGFQRVAQRKPSARRPAWRTLRLRVVVRDIHAGGVGPRLSSESLAELAAIVETGPDREKDGVVRWRRVDLKRVVKERFGVEFCERYIGTILKRLGFSHMSARPRHPKQNGQIVEAFKKKLRERVERASG